MFKPLKTPFNISHSIEENEDKIMVDVSVTPYNGYLQEELIILGYEYAEQILREEGMIFRECLNTESRINNKKANQSKNTWIFSKDKPQKKRNRKKVLDKSSECVIMSKEELETTSATKKRKSKKATKKAH